MITAHPKPGRALTVRRRALRVVLAAALLALPASCGIGESVADACITKKRVYERAQKRKTSLRVAGVPAEAAVHRAATKRLAAARADYTACTAAHSGESI